MQVILDSNEFEVYKTMTNGGLCRDAAIIQMVNTADYFEVIEDSDEEEEFEEIEIDEETPEEETEEGV